MPKKRFSTNNGKALIKRFAFLPFLFSITNKNLCYSIIFRQLILHTSKINFVLLYLIKNLLSVIVIGNEKKKIK